MVYYQLTHASPVNTPTNLDVVNSELGENQSQKATTGDDEREERPSTSDPDVPAG